MQRSRFEWAALAVWLSMCKHHLISRSTVAHANAWKREVLPAQMTEGSPSRRFAQPASGMDGSDSAKDGIHPEALVAPKAS